MLNTPLVPVSEVLVEFDHCAHSNGEPVDLHTENKMGGGELPERMRIPHYSTYNYENINKFPELVKYQQDLAKQGLKDPWLRSVLIVFKWVGY